jgi:hypothetical protein
VERRFPAHQERNVRHFYQDDVPTIGAACGLQRSEVVPTSGTVSGDRDQDKVAL